ncbi:hypothetical protein QTP70_007091 [Hemibagrus guttatus]|uniref:Alkylated DNA repair protein AlkB homologue 8 N-terminal domain-containing protein n=1 Tax=Hemibagrus guttatus TaxID=175788 RepID=A0AAE0VC52_9TELE|nr:hypothetical protein QTP70_007091 [Hemibagrus guttatus]
MINESPVERVDSFRYLSVHITQELSWFCNINTMVKKARQRLYHLRRLRDFRLPSKVLRNFYSCTIESILMGNIATWFGNSTMQDRQALQRVVNKNFGLVIRVSYCSRAPPEEEVSGSIRRAGGRENTESEVGDRQ